MNVSSIYQTAIAVCVSILTACAGGDIVELPPRPDAERIWAVRFDVRAIALATGDTYQLSATAVNGRNEPMTGVSAIRFRSLNLDCVSVDSNGMMTTLLPTSSAPVVAELVADGATYTDTVAVYVTAASYDAKSIAIYDWSMRPIPTSIDLDAGLSYNPQLLDNFGNAIPGIRPVVVSSDSTILSGGGTYSTGKRIGRAKLRASIFAYGRTIIDSVEITVRVPDDVKLWVYLAGERTTLVATGGTVTWLNYTSYPKVPLNVTFTETSSEVVGGNIERLDTYESASRTFTVPGTYRYRDTINKTSGAVLVRDQPVY